MAQQKRKPVLQEHKKIGKKFIPPWSYLLGPTRETSWVELGIPEFLWIACLHRSSGLERGTELALKLSQAAFSIYPQHKGWFAALSDYKLITADHRSHLIEKLEKQGLVPELRSGLASLSRLYPAHPLSFLSATVVAPTDVDRRWMRDTVFPLYDKTERTTVLVQGTVVYLGFVNDRLKVASGLVLANFPKLEEYPNSAESKLVAAAVRSTILMIIGAENHETTATWARVFWNQGLATDNCLLP